MGDEFKPKRQYMHGNYFIIEAVNDAGEEKVIRLTLEEASNMLEAAKEALRKMKEKE